ncbi:hypothetical protein DFH07DRAFT_948412 [Mycena maculata]|uniref:F-box domain-containing protein n=1 Tax=Mycena maculata TaxID=230809 RepID=A0AAD7KHU3_9AGAR|nr:hypothetical protein DFH07DRAFT_948412 [Mycena maculata]
MSTNGGTQSVLHRLPNEVLSEFIAWSRPQEQTALSRVSKLFHKLTARFLYRTLKISVPHKVKRCLSTLAKNPGLLLFVKTIDLTRCPKKPGDTFDIFELIARMQNLEMLLFGSRDAPPHMTSPLAGRTFLFPHLYCLHIGLKSREGPPIVEFIQAHPKLSVLKLSGHAPRALTDSADIALPALRHLQAHAPAIPPLVRLNRLAAAAVVWRDSAEPLAPPLDALREGSHASLVRLSCKRPSTNVDLIELVACFPLLENLKVTDRHGQGFSYDDGYFLKRNDVRRIAAALARLKNLRTFVFTYAHRPNQTYDGALLTALVEACPTLTQFTLNTVKWERPYAGAEWTPVMDVGGNGGRRKASRYMQSVSPA